jgi:hypothetical protein
MHGRPCTRVRWRPSCGTRIQAWSAMAVALVGLAVFTRAPTGAAALGCAAFDTSGLPDPPTTFEEQRLWDEILTACRYPELAPTTHAKLAQYYDRRGLTGLAARERAAAQGTTAPAGADMAIAVPSPVLSTVPLAADDLDPGHFDLSAFPLEPTNFEEQLVLESVRYATTPSLLAFAHRQLGRYYAARGRPDLAAGEYARAVAADPTNPRGYDGLAALSEAVGGEANVDLRDIAARLRAAGHASDDEEEPEPEVTLAGTESQWQEVSVEFNRRMNALYRSPVWGQLNRTLFPRLYGR